MSVALTVAICTYNGEHRLPEVLECLRSQSNTASFQWEILVVDNNSQDKTARLIQAFQADWHHPCPLRYCFEAQQGSAFARQRAAQEAAGELIAFIDDDNLPAPDWVASAYAFAQAYPQAGAFASRIRPAYEVEPSADFERIAPFLAITDLGESALLFHPRTKLLPPTAGLVVRQQAWQVCVPPRLLQKGRVGSSAGHAIADSEPGEDLEILLYIQQAGWEIWYNPQMQIQHKIPQWRLERAYLIGLCRGIGLSRYFTRMLSFPAWQRPLVTVAYGLNDSRKLIRHWLKYRRLLGQDLVADCEMVLFWSSLLSPLYFWNKKLQALLNTPNPVFMPVPQTPIPEEHPANDLPPLL